MTRTTPDEHLNEPVLRHVRQDFVRIPQAHTVGEALAHVRQGQSGSRIVYFYVVDEQNRLKGVVPTRRLLLNPPETPIRAIMVDRVIALPDTATLFDACELFLLHGLLALPVVDGEGRMVGVIDVELYTEEIGDLARREESDHVFQLIGVCLAELRRASVPAAFRSRFPWLLCNIAGGLACAAVATVFEHVLDEVIALALFIPVVLALAESVSIQSLTLTVQSQHGKPLTWVETLARAGRELPLGLLLGLGCGALVAAFAWIWQGRGMVAACLLLSIVLSVSTAALVGLIAPSVLRSMRRDPRVASGPIALALTDLATLFFYLGLATLLLA